jgi:hypothetical protein
MIVPFRITLSAIRTVPRRASWSDAQLVEAVDRAPDAHLDAVGKVRSFDVRPGDGRMVRLQFERDEAAPRRKGSGQPDGTVPPEGADLQDSARPDDLGYQVEQPSLECGDLDRGEAGGLGGAQGLLEYGIRQPEPVDKVAVHRIPHGRFRGGRVGTRSIGTSSR